MSGEGKETPPIEVPAVAQAGDLVMESCALEYKGLTLEAECGTLVVPENRSDPGSPLISLPVQRFRATENAAAEPICYLWGGPGQSNLKSEAPPDWLRSRYDLVTVGYRGVDGSSVLDLPEFSEALKGKGSDLLSDESLDAIGAALAAGAARLQRQGVDLAGYTVPEMVADMEAARIGLGYGRINLYTESFGTRIAQIYSALHPESLHRVLMLSAVAPGRLVWEPAKIDAQLAYYAELYAQDVECSQRTPDLLTTLRNVFADMPTRWGPIPIDPGKVRAITRRMIEQTATANLALDALIAAESGDPAGLALMSVGYTRQFDIPHAFTWGHLIGLLQSTGYDPARDYRADLDSTGSIMGAPQSLVLWSRVDRWPYTPIPAELRQLQPSDVETLVVVMGSIDFATPQEYARDELMPYLNRGQWVLLSESGHAEADTQREAFIRLVTTFYETGTGDDSLFEYKPMDFSVERSLSDTARGIVRSFALLLLLVLLVPALLIGALTWWKRRRKRKGSA
jgi:pimeloyl-ACP methyl ester carboxylesterase